MTTELTILPRTLIKEFQEQCFFKAQISQSYAFESSSQSLQENSEIAFSRRVINNKIRERKTTIHKDLKLEITREEYVHAEMRDDGCS